jgi:hypothetical protein
MPFRIRSGDGPSCVNHVSRGSITVHLSVLSVRILGLSFCGVMVADSHCNTPCQTEHEPRLSRS